MTSTTTDRISGFSASAALKIPCRVATTANITLSGTQTIDGVAVVADDRVLVKNQTTSSENGIYVVDSGTWSRARDFDGTGDAVYGTLVFVTSGSTYTATFWRLATADTVDIGTDNITWTQANSTLAGVTTYGGTLLAANSSSSARELLGAVSTTAVTTIGGAVMAAGSSSSALELIGGVTSTVGITRVSTAVDNALTRFSSAGEVQGSGITVDDDNAIYGDWKALVTTTSTALTLSSTHAGKIVEFSATNPITVTLPGTTTETLVAGFYAGISVISTAVIAVVLQGTDTLISRSTLTNIAPKGAMAWVRKQTAGTPNGWRLWGDLST